MNSIKIIDFLTARSRCDDGENTRLAVTLINSVPIPLNKLLEADEALYAVNAILHRSTTSFHRFFLVRTEGGQIAGVREFSDDVARKRAVAEDYV